MKLLAGSQFNVGVASIFPVCLQRHDDIVEFRSFAKHHFCHQSSVMRTPFKRPAEREARAVFVGTQKPENIRYLCAVQVDRHKVKYKYMLGSSGAIRST